MPPLLAAPSAFAGVARGRARLLLAGLLLVLLAVTGVAGTVDGSDAHVSYALDSGAIEGVRHGGDYYAVAAAIVQGDDALARPIVGTRLPTLAVVAAAVPRRVFAAMLAALALAVALTWYERLAPALAGRGARFASAALILAGLVTAFRPEGILAHESWAGLFLALAFARWRPGAALEAMGWGLAAALVDERAGLLFAVMAAFAWRAGDRREAAGWLAAAALLTLTIVVHRHAEQVAGIDFDIGDRLVAGVGGALSALADATALAFLPASAAAVLATLALAGWSGWRDPLASRLVATLLGLIAIAAWLPAGGDAAALVAPALLAGLVFVPAGLRDLARAALDTRRITVRRVAR